jgi:hypothetical protein
MERLRTKRRVRRPVSLVGDIDWPTRAVTMRVLDLDGREVENRAAQTDDAAERLSRPAFGGEGKGVRRGTWQDSSLASVSSLLRAAILYCGRPQIALRPLQQDTRPRRETSARKGKRRPSFVAE